ncbi:MAG: exonuclease domain-containing protein, partial [Actinomycetota bacterium]
MQRTLDDLGTPLFSTTFVVLDLETTGGSPTGDAITEIGALKSRGGEVIGTFHTLVSPGRPIPASIQVLTGIGDATVAGAPPIEAVLPSLWEFLDGAVLVAHNARFDASFLAAAFARHGYRVPFRRTVCTLRLARRLLAGETRDLRLETLARHLGAAAEPCHRAFPDARATLDVFHRLLELAGPVGVLTCEDLLVFSRTGRAPD